jgi:hypothetical protein
MNPFHAASLPLKPPIGKTHTPEDSIKQVTVKEFEREEFRSKVPGENVVEGVSSRAGSYAEFSRSEQKSISIAVER